MQTLLKLESSRLFRDTVTKWAGAIEDGAVTEALFLAGEVRATAAVVLAHPAVLKDYLHRARLPETCDYLRASEVLSEFFYTITLMTFGQSDSRD